MEELKQTIKETIESEPLKEFDLKFVGVGADKAVFETPGSQRKLIKVSIFILRKRISEMLHKVPKEERRWNKLQKERIAEQKEYEENVAEVFGKEHFPRKGVFRAKIPLSKEVLLKIVDENEKSLVEELSEDAPFEVEMVAETQLTAEELKNPEKFETQSFNTDLMIADQFKGEGHIQAALGRVREFINSRFMAEYDKLLKDEEFKKVVEEIVRKIIAYSKKTGLMIDIFGGDNITIFKKEDGSWDYHMLDVILPGAQKGWEENIKDDKGLHLLRHYFTYFYSINSLAKKLGVEDNLEMEDLIYFKGAEVPTGRFPEQEDSYKHMVKSQEISKG